MLGQSKMSVSYLTEVEPTSHTGNEGYEAGSAFEKDTDGFGDETEDELSATQFDALIWRTRSERRLSKIPEFPNDADNGFHLHCCRWRRIRR